MISVLQDMEEAVAAETVGTMTMVVNVDHITEMAIVTAINKIGMVEAIRAAGQLKVNKAGRQTARATADI